MRLLGSWLESVALICHSNKYEYLSYFKMRKDILRSDWAYLLTIFKCP